MAVAAADAVADARLKRIRCGSARRQTQRGGGGRKTAARGPAAAAATAAAAAATTPARRLNGMGLVQIVSSRCVYHRYVLAS